MTSAVMTVVAGNGAVVMPCWICGFQPSDARSHEARLRLQAGVSRGELSRPPKLPLRTQDLSPLIAGSTSLPKKSMTSD